MSTLMLMKSINQEYEFFKSFCQLKSCNRSPESELMIEGLKKKGIKISLKNNKYKLQHDIVSLSEKKILEGFDAESISLLDRLDVVYQTDSTNKAILENCSINKYSILVAESQIKGQGRREKKWNSPLAENIYLSIKFNLPDSKNIHFLPLITAVSLCKSLIKFDIFDCRIKWPNDIYLDAKKLGGILVESRYNTETGYTVVVGIGLNVNMQSNREIDQLWTSIFLKLNMRLDRNPIIATILTDLFNVYKELSILDINKFISDWYLLDYLRDRQVLIKEESLEFSATALGISKDGALMVEFYEEKNMLNKITKKIYAADVSVKPV